MGCCGSCVNTRPTSSTPSPVNAGQTCLAPDYVLVHRAAEDRLTDALAAVVRRRFGDDPSRSPDFGRIVNTRHYDRIMALVDGGGYDRVVCGGSGERETRFIAPTVLAGVKPEAPVMDDEIFGPVLPVLAVDDIDEAIRFVNQRPAPLALSIFSRSAATAERVLRSTSSGGACVNDALTHVLVPTLPFGGVGPSGTGAYHGRFGYELFSHRRAVLSRPTWFEMPTMYAPYTAWKERLNRKLF
jgi:aldehyde dehydrogenase (NAD+)